MTGGVSQEDAGDLVHVSVNGEAVEANLSIPAGAEGIVLFAHGTGSSRHSSRNNFVADDLRDGGLATLLIDLLTEEEKEIDRRTRRVRFDIERLANRVTGATEWLLEQEETEHLNVGIFGSSTGAAGALIAAARRPEAVVAVVSRGGRVDLAEAVFGQVQAPALFIVGGDDVQVRELNRQALRQMEGDHEMEVVPGAGHLFEGAGELEQVAGLARDWFQHHLT